MSIFNLWLLYIIPIIHKHILYVDMKHIYILFCNYACNVCTFPPISLFFLNSVAVSSAISYGLFSSPLTYGPLLCIGKVLCCFQLGVHFSCGFIFFSLLFELYLLILNHLFLTLLPLGFLISSWCLFHSLLGNTLFWLFFVECF